MIQFEFVLTLVMVSILFAGDVVSMGHLSYSLAVIPTPKSMIRCDAPSLVSLDSHSSGYYNFSLAIDRLYHGRVIDSTLDVSKLRQISQTQIWDPGSSSIAIGKDGVISRSDHNQKVCLMVRMTTNVYPVRIVTSGACRSTHEVCVDRYKSGTTAISAVDVFFVSATIWVAEVQRMRTKRSNQHPIRVYGTITNTHFSFSRRVPKSTVLRCNGWIADFDFRKRKRWYIDKQQMFPKLDSHSRLMDKTRATKHIFRIAELHLFCFFVKEIFDCIYFLMFIITIFGSY